MKTNKKDLSNQRQVIEKKIRPWVPLRGDRVPQSGWVKAVRGALGINTRQLADHLGVDHSAVLRLEERESQGKATLDLVDKVARAMDCKLVYAIVPNEPYTTLEEILDQKTRQLAQDIVQNVEHSMQLESQGTDAADQAKQIERLAYDLKLKMDSRIWNKTKKKKTK
jgi:predicted DNA-binding mobile mystery protein A